MSEVDRSDSGALTESPTLLPAHAEPAQGEAARGESSGAGGTPPARTPDPTERAPAAGEPVTNGAPGATPALNPDGTPKKRRRRGSRSGRGRKKPGTTNAGGQTAIRAPAGDGPSMSGSEDWSAADADRGLTDDDIGEQAREDAGIAKPASGRVQRAPAAKPDAAAKPRVGDTRPGTPAPAAATPTGEEPAKKRRRRRGGRGRSKGGTGDRPAGIETGSRTARTQKPS